MQIYYNFMYYEICFFRKIGVNYKPVIKQTITIIMNAMLRIKKMDLTVPEKAFEG